MYKKTTKRALLMSALSLLMCISMLIGSTYAWFTDEVISSGNIIKSGTLDVTMEWADGTTDPANTTWTDAAEGAIFNYDLWEPGYTEVRHIKIANAGTLALNYQINIVANGEVSNLADVIDVYYVDPAVQVVDRTALSAEMKLGTLTEVLAAIRTTASGNLLAGKADTITLALTMQETAGNEYQGLSIGSDFSVQLMATQYSYEKDSFDDQYDAGAEYPKQVIKASSAADLTAALTSGAEMPIALVCDIEDFSGAITTASVVDLGGYTLDSKGMTVKEDLNMSNGDVSMRTTSGYLDIRPTEDGVYTFKNVDFVNEYKRKANNNTGSDRIEYMVKLYPMAKDIKSTFVFENCTFENASVYFGASSDKPADIDVTLKNCTFNAMMGSDPVIEFASTTTGTVNIENCTFNITATYSNQAVIGIKNWSSITINVTATNNILNANKAIPYTYDPAKGETEVDSVKIGNVASVRNYYLFDALSGGYSTINEAGTVLNGDVAIASKYVLKTN